MATHRHSDQMRTDSADSAGLLCESCGAVWISAGPSDGSNGCLQCGGTLSPGDGAGPEQQESAPPAVVLGGV